MPSERNEPFRAAAMDVAAAKPWKGNTIRALACLDVVRERLRLRQQPMSVIGVRNKDHWIQQLLPCICHFGGRQRDSIIIAPEPCISPIGPGCQTPLGGRRGDGLVDMDVQARCETETVCGSPKTDIAGDSSHLPSNFLGGFLARRRRCGTASASRSFFFKSRLLRCDRSASTSRHLLI